MGMPCARAPNTALMAAVSVLSLASVPVEIGAWSYIGPHCVIEAGSRIGRGIDGCEIRAFLGRSFCTCLFDTGVETDIREGRLIRVLDDWCPPFDGFSLYYSSRRQMRPALRAFIDFFRWRG